MSPREQELEPLDATTEPASRVVNVRRRPEEFGPFLTTRDLLEYLPCPSMAAAHSWIYRHGITRRSNGSFARVDVDRELKRRSLRGAHLRAGNRVRRSA